MVTTVYCFDRDFTVSVNPEPEKESVPLSWIKELAHNIEKVDVWAIGNQHLRYEARIPGVYYSKILRDLYLQEYNEEMDNDIVYMPGRRERLHLINDYYSSVFDEPPRLVVIDDVNLTDLENEGWEYYSPQEFFYRVVENKEKFSQQMKNTNFTDTPFTEMSNTPEYTNNYVPEVINTNKLPVPGDGHRGWYSSE